MALFVLFSVVAILAYNLNDQIANRRRQERQVQKEIIHNKAVLQFENSIDKFAVIVAGLKSYVSTGGDFLSPERMQDFTNNMLENINFKDSIIISYLDSTHTFVYSYDRNEINQNRLVGRNVSDIRSNEEIDYLNMVMMSDKIHLNDPINLVEGWLGIPLLFGVKDGKQPVGYMAPIINFSTIIQSIYEEAPEDIYFKFCTGDGVEFDRGAICDGSTVYHQYADPDYYKKHKVDDQFLESRIDLFDNQFVIGTAYQDADIDVANQNLILIGFLIFTAGLFTYIGREYNRRLVINKYLEDARQRVSYQNEELERNKKAFVDLLTNVNDGIVECNADGKITYANAKMLEMVNLDIPEVYQLGIWDFVFEDDRDQMREFYRQQFKEQSKNCVYEFRLKPKDQEPFWVEHRSTMHYEQKKMVKFRSVTRNISENVRLRTELESARIKAEEASKAKDQFLAMMSHEIRTPLNGIVGTANLLMDNENSERKVAQLNILKQSASHLNAIVNDILDYRKIEEGRLALNENEFNLRHLIKGVYYNYHDQGIDLGLDIRLNIGDGLADSYVGDQVRIAQVLHNLLNNAIKFTDQGHVELCVSVSSQSDKKDLVHFKIEDSGIGIPEDKKEQIFEIFTQAGTSSNHTGGSGLGLTITRRLLHLMNSDIKFSSELGQGSCFEFELEMTKGSGDINREETVGSAARLTLDAVVLVVDDNKFNMVIAKDFLEDWGCKTLEAYNGIEALEVLKSESVDIVLMDIQMPEMDGYETSRIIRQTNPSLPIIALTADVVGDVIKRVYASGMNGFISKPFDPEEFYQKVKMFSTK